jgi:hypothetical protein
MQKLNVYFSMLEELRNSIGLYKTFGDRYYIIRAKFYINLLAVYRISRNIRFGAS